MTGFVRRQVSRQRIAVLFSVAIVWSLLALVPDMGLRSRSTPPMIEISTSYAGASAPQVARLVIAPLERLVAGIKGVRHVYSASLHGQGSVSVQFAAGISTDQALVLVHNRLEAGRDQLPRGVGLPLVRARREASLPLMTLSLWSNSLDEASLRLAALEVGQRLAAFKGIAGSHIVGGASLQVNIEILPERLQAFALPMARIATLVRSARQFSNKADLKNLIVGVRAGRPVFLRDVASIGETPGVSANVVKYYTGPSAAYSGLVETDGARAITLVLSRQKGSNGAKLARLLSTRISELQKKFLPANLHLVMARNYSRANSSENGNGFDIVVKMPVGTSLQDTAKAVAKLAAPLRDIYEIKAVQTYSGIASPFGSGDLARARHLPLSPAQGELQIELLDAEQHQRTTIEVAKAVRIRLAPLAQKLGARLVVSNGLKTAPRIAPLLVAEIYGAKVDTRRKVAHDLAPMFEKAKAIASLEKAGADPHDSWVFTMRPDRLTRHAISTGQLIDQLSLAMGETKLGTLRPDNALEPRLITLRAARSVRSDIDRLLHLPVISSSGAITPLGELGTFRLQPGAPTIFRKDQRLVEYVAGRLRTESAVSIKQAIAQIGQQLKSYVLPANITLAGRVWKGEKRVDGQGFDWSSSQNKLVGAFTSLSAGTWLLLAALLLSALRLLSGQKRLTLLVQQFALWSGKVVKILLRPVWHKLHVLFVWLRSLPGRLADILIAQDPDYDSSGFDMEAPGDTVSDTADKSHAAFVAALGDDDHELPKREGSPRDDLQRILGIGPVIETVLHKNKLVCFEQIARLSNDQISRIDAQLSQKNKGAVGSIWRDKWQAQARALIEGRDPAEVIRELNQAKSGKKTVKAVANDTGWAAFS